MLGRATELKEYKNLCRGKKPSILVTSESNKFCIDISRCVNISLGSNEDVINHNADLIVKKDIASRNDFIEKNPEINLPNDLNVDFNSENFPSLIDVNSPTGIAPLREEMSNGNNSWVKIASKGLKPSSSKLIPNDRSHLEC